MDPFRQLIAEHLDAFADIIGQSEILGVVEIDEEQKISSHNRYFKKLLSTSQSLYGQSIFTFLFPESHKVIPLASGVKTLSAVLNFKAADSSALPLSCDIIRLKGRRLLIIGGHHMVTNEQILQKMTLLSNEMANMARDLSRKNRELAEAQSKIKILGGIVPICMHCKKIRDDQGYWRQLEKYISEHSEAQFSHGICDQCLRDHYPELKRHE